MSRYESFVKGWTIVYELWPTQLVVSSSNRDERQVNKIELNQCGATPDTGVTANDVYYPPRVWVVAALILLFSALVLGTMTGFDTLFTGETLAKYGLVLILELIGLNMVLPHLLKIRREQHYAVFKSNTTGHALINLVSLPDPQSDFQEFIDQIAAAIRRQNGGNDEGKWNIKVIN